MVPWDVSGVAQCRIVYKGSASIHVDVPIFLCCRGYSSPQSPPRHCFTAGGFINENFFLAAMQLRCLGDGGWRGIRVSWVFHQCHGTVHRAVLSTSCLVKWISVRIHHHHHQFLPPPSLSNTDSLLLHLQWLGDRMSWCEPFSPQKHRSTES